MNDEVLSELLVQKGVMTEKQVRKAVELMDHMGEQGNLAQVVVRLGYASDAQVKEILKEHKATGFDLADAELDVEALSKMPEEFLKDKAVIPLKHEKEGKILLATASEGDLETIESVQFMTNSLVETTLVARPDILKKLEEIFTVSGSDEDMKEIDIVKGEEHVLEEEPEIILEALAEILFEKGVISKRELFLKTRELSE